MEYLNQLQKAFKKASDAPGVNVPGSFWPFNQVKFNTEVKAESQNEVPQSEPELPTVAVPATDQVQSFFLEFPDANAVSFYNWLKANGYLIAKENAQEADSASSLTQVLRAEESIKPLFRARMREASGGDTITGFTKFKCVLLEEGLGNLRDGFYYTRECIESAITVFEGKKIYADHPTSDEEQIRPERSVRDILGYFEGMALEEGESGQALLVGNVSVLPDPAFAWARALMREAFEYSKKYPDQDLIGLSINANGTAKPVRFEEFVANATLPESAKLKLNQARESGLDTVRVVTKLDSAVSCDLVTEAGAKGRIIQPLK